MTSAFAGSCAPRHKTPGLGLQSSTLTVAPASCRLSGRRLAARFVWRQSSENSAMTAGRTPGLTAGATPALPLRFRFQNPGAKV